MLWFGISLRAAESMQVARDWYRVGIFCKFYIRKLYINIYV